MISILLVLLATLNAELLYTVNLPEAPKGEAMLLGSQGTERAFYLTLNGQLACVDATDGNRLWTRGLGSFASAELAGCGDRVVAAGGGRAKRIKCFDIAGTRLWETQMRDVAVLAMDDELVVAGNLKGELAAFGAENGSRLWVSKMQSPLSMRPVLTDVEIWVMDDEGKLKVLDRESGEQVKSMDLGHGVKAFSIDREGKLIIYSGSGQLIRHDVEGREFWKIQLGECPKEMLLSDKTIYEADAFGMVAAINTADGIIVWQSDLEEPISSNLLLDKVNKMVIVGGSRGKITGWDAINGEKKLTVSTDQRAVNLLRIGDLLLVGGGDGKLRGYKLSN